MVVTVSRDCRATRSGPEPAGAFGQVPAERAFVRPEEHTVADDGLPLDQDVPGSPIGTEDQSRERVGDVAEIVAGPDDQVCPVAGFEHADVVPPEAPSAALGRQA